MQLTDREESLLKEILEHRNECGGSDSTYWQKRFDDPALTHDKEVLLRGTFGKLKQKGMISILWADNIPYEIDVLSDGLTYFEDKEATIPMKEIPTIFVSYQQESGSDFVNDLEEVLQGKAKVIRDTHLDAWGDLPKFMESIRSQDFAVMVITDKYLKSVACMTEVANFMRERDWDKRVMFAVLDQSIYSKENDYLQYWENRRKELDKQRKSDNVGSGELLSIAEKIQEIGKFFAELNDFWKVLCSKKNPKIWRILIDILRRIETTFPIDLGQHRTKHR